MANASLISIEVVYLGPEFEFLRSLELPLGSTVAQAIEQSGVLERLPDFEPSKSNVGIFSRKVALDQELQEADRVELYRPLLMTPNEIRLRRAELKAQRGKPR